MSMDNGEFSITGIDISNIVNRYEMNGIVRALYNISCVDGALPAGLKCDIGDNTVRIHGTLTCESTGMHNISFMDGIDGVSTTIYITAIVASVRPIISNVDSILYRQMGNPPFSITPSLYREPGVLVGSEYAPNFTFESSETGVATVDASGQVTILAPGTTVITVGTEGNVYYLEANPVTCTLHVVDRTQDPSPSDPGSNTSTNKNTVNASSKTEEPALSEFELFLQQQAARIKNAKAGATITINSDVWNSYPLWFMELIKERRDINIIMKYNYKGIHYTADIPTKTAVTLDKKTPWYGPLKIADMFGAQTK